MEPLTALSLASAIVQFVGFGSKILKTGYEVYQSTSGLAQEHVDLAELTTSLYSFQTRLASPSASPATPTPDEKALQELATRCSELANELLKLLSNLQVKGDGLIRTWESLRQTLRSIGKKKQISRLEKLLDEIGRQISSRLLYLIREDTSSLSMQIRSLNNARDRLNLQLKAGLEDARKLIIAELEAQSTALGKIQSVVKDDQSRKHDVEILKAYYASLQVVPNHLTQLNNEVTRVSKSQRILESLLFKEISDREFQIHESHGDTFEWIFEDDNTTFKRWLSEGNDVFWVCGKAGSGKSTLMKFLAQHDKTKTLLEEWAGDERLIFASYYFWSSGFDIQKSQLGLMQSLLYQILRQCPRLILFASVRRWEATELEIIGPDPWTQTELSFAFDKNLSRGRLTSRFCFFVDGLDEYSGDHYKLMKDFGRLSQSSQVTFCVSSRPWRVFENHYGQKIDLKLVLEDLTRNDIYQYVETLLNKDERFRRLVIRDPKVSSIVDMIRDRAEGVFLWVFLVVRSMLRGLNEDDDASELEERLSQIPTDMNAFFRKILQGIDDAYRDYTMRALQLAAVGVPMRLIAFAYIARDLKDPSFALKAKIAPLNTDESEALCEQAAGNVTKWCRDLLEVDFAPCRQYDPRWRYKWESGMVIFLHRSVKDFLLLPATQETFRANPVCCRSTHDILCKIHLAAFKGHYDTSIRSVSECGTIKDLIFGILKDAKQREIHECLPSFEVLQELDKVLKAMTTENTKHFAPSSVLKLAVRGDLMIYVGHMISRDSSKIHDLLPYAILPVTGDEFSEGMERPSMDMLHCLLENGADPNEKLKWIHREDSTVWQRCLAIDLLWSGGEREWASAKLMLQHGADPEVKVWEPRGGQPLDIRSCLLEIYESPPWEHELDQLLADCRAKWKTQHSWRARMKRRLRFES